MYVPISLNILESTCIPISLNMGYSNLSDTEAPKIPTFQGSKNSDTVLGQAPKCPTAEN